MCGAVTAQEGRNVEFIWPKGAVSSWGRRKYVGVGTGAAGDRTIKQYNRELSGVWIKLFPNSVDPCPLLLCWIYTPIFVFHSHIFLLPLDAVGNNTNKLKHTRDILLELVSLVKLQISDPSLQVLCYLYYLYYAFIWHLWDGRLLQPNQQKFVLVNFQNFLVINHISTK